VLSDRKSVCDGYILLAQLAVDKPCQGEGLGAITLVNALRRCARLSRQGEVPAIAVILDVANDEAMAFYRRFEAFRELPQPGRCGNPRLFIPMKAVERL
jgi:GNAT superfamily N-acetyltransferase